MHEPALYGMDRNLQGKNGVKFAREKAM